MTEVLLSDDAKSEFSDSLREYNMNGFQNQHGRVHQNHCTLVFLVIGWISQIANAAEVITIAGNGAHALSGDGGPAVRAGIGGPFEVVIGPDGALYVSDTGSGQPFTDSSGGTAVGRVLRIVKLDTTDVPESPPAIRLSAAPNPFRDGVDFFVDLPEASAVRLTLFDAQGRLVASLPATDRDAASHRIHWDGRDDRGRPTAPGVFFARLDAGNDRRTIKLVRSR